MFGAEPGVDEALVLLLALQGAVVAEVVVVAVDGDDGLAGPLVEAVGGEGAVLGAWHGGGASERYRYAYRIIGSGRALERRGVRVSCDQPRSCKWALQDLNL